MNKTSQDFKILTDHGKSTKILNKFYTHTHTHTHTYTHVHHTSNELCNSTLPHINDTVP